VGAYMRWMYAMTSFTPNLILSGVRGPSQGHMSHVLLEVSRLAVLELNTSPSPAGGARNLPSGRDLHGKTCIQREHLRKISVYSLFFYVFLFLILCLSHLSLAVQHA
jgi:hypothetical protein